MNCWVWLARISYQAGWLCAGTATHGNSHTRPYAAMVEIGHFSLSWHHVPGNNAFRESSCKSDGMCLQTPLLAGIAVNQRQEG